MNFQEFVKLCKGETNLYYFFSTDSGVYIRDKIKEVSFLNEPNSIVLTFLSGSLTLREESCKIQTAPYPEDGFEIPCYFCYYIEAGPTVNAVKKFAGFLYKPKDENHFEYFNYGRTDFKSSEGVCYRMGQE